MNEHNCNCFFVAEMLEGGCVYTSQWYKKSIFVMGISLNAWNKLYRVDNFFVLLEMYIFS
jgi:hypothetical protein